METQTQTTVQINGRDYGVEYIAPDPTHPLDPDKCHYRIFGPRAGYYTMRNRKTSDLMFLVSENGAVSSHGLRNVWLSDRGGQLRQVKLL